MITQVQAAALSAGPFGVLAYQAPQGFDSSSLTATTGVQLTASTGGAAVTIGLNTAGLAAVAAAVGTYLGALSAAKKAQLFSALTGCPSITIAPSGISVPVHGADLASFTATLAAVLNSAGNYSASPS
jgi:hypothetical protein